MSVVIPTYRRAAAVQWAIESALSQTRLPLEVIVVDDGSHDGTIERLSELANDRLLVLSHPRNLGGAAARNTGIRHSRGEWIAFLDSDDRWYPSKLEMQWDLINTQPDVDAVYCAFERRSKAGIRTIRPPLDRALRDLLLERRYVITLSTLMVRRARLNELGGFDDALPSYQDTDLFLRLVRHSRVGYVNEVLVTQDVDGEDRITSRLDLRIKGYQRILEKHADLLSTNRRGFAAYWSEMGRLLARSGAVSAARSAYWRSLRLHPFRFITAVRALECTRGRWLIDWLRASLGRVQR